MMLEHLGLEDAAQVVVAAIETVLDDPAARTRDMGGGATIEHCGRAVAAAIQALPVSS
jgi:tartrate dehydrogenase/decarboxylase/D-malate dehydrogenase